MKATLTTRRSAKVILAAGWLSLCLAAVLFAAVQAHAFLIRSDPPDNSLLEASPPQVQLWFSEAIIPRFSSLRIFDLNGQEITPISFEVHPSDPPSMRASLPPLANGVYTVNWQAYSAVDGHGSQGYFVFRIGEGSSAGGSAQSAGAGGISRTSLMEAVLRWLNYLGIFLLVGCMGVLPFVLMPRETGLSDAQQQRDAADLPSLYQSARLRVLKLALYSAGFTFMVGLVQFAEQVRTVSASLPGSLSPAEIAGFMLTSTPWGQAWVARQVILVVLFFIFLGSVRRGDLPRRSGIAAVVLLVALLAAQSLVSHAAAGEKPLLPVLVDFLHLGFAGLWMGGLIALAVGLLPLLLKDKALFKENLRLVWGPFSLLAAISVGVVMVTGIFSTGLEVISADGLLLSPYGKTLVAKVSLVLVAGLIGFTNSLLLHPRLAAPLASQYGKPQGWTPVSLSKFPRLVAAEVLLGLTVLLLAGLLTSIPPARAPAYAIDPDIQSIDVMQPVNDLFVTLSVRPNRPGTNIFNIRVLNSRRPPPAETLRLILKLTYLDQEIGSTTQDVPLILSESLQDTYQLASDYLTQPGKWAVEVVVRRAGLPDSRTTFNWTVLPLGEIKLTVVSRFHWGPYLQVCAGLLALLFLGIGLLVYLRLASRPRVDNT